MRWRGLLAGVLVALGLAGPALADDRDTLTALLEDNLSGAGRLVTITGFQGALSSQATIQELTIADGQGVWLTLKGVTLDWNRAALLGGTLAVNQLSADEIDLDRLPVAEQGTSLPAATAQPFALPSLPVAVSLGKISARSFALGPAVLGQKVTGTLDADASLIDGQGHIRLAVERTDAVLGRLSLIAVYANATDELTLAVEAEEAAGGLAVSALGVPGKPSAHLVLGGKGPLTGFTANLRLDTDGVTRLAGAVKLTGGSDGAREFTADLGGNMAPLFAPDYAAFFGDRIALHVQGRREADGRLDLPELTLTAAALDLKGAVAIAADGLPLKVDLKGTLRAADGAPVLLPLAGTPTRVGRADLALAYDAAVSEDWTGRLHVAGLDRADLKADDLELAGQGHIRHGGAAGVTAAVTLDAVGLAPADPALAQALGTEADGTVTLDWLSGSGKVALSDLSLHAGDVVLATRGTIGGIETGLRLDGHVDLTAGDLTRFAALAGQPLAGAVDLSLDGWVSPLSGQFDADIAAKGQALRSGVAQVDGLLAGASTLTLAGKRDEGGTTLRRLTLQADGLDADVAGRVTASGADVSGKVALADLSVLNLGVKGGIAADASFSGSLDSGHLVLTGTGTDLSMGQAQADALAKGETTLALDLALAGSRIGITRADISGPALHLGVTGSYDPAGSDLSATLDLPQLAVLQPGWSGRLSAQASLTGTPRALAAKLEAQSQDLAIGNALADKLIRGAGTLSAEVQVQGRRLLVDRLTLSTPAFSASATGRARDLQVRGQVNNLGLILPDFPGVLRLDGSVQQTDAATALDLKLSGPGQIDARVAGTLAPGFGQGKLTARGTALAGLANPFIAPRVLAGDLSFNLALDGPLALNSVTGTVGLKDGRMADPDLPIALEGMTLASRLSGGTADVNLKSGFKGGGEVQVTGSVGLLPPMPADLKIRLAGATLRDPNLYQTRVDGLLTFQGPALGGATVAGTVTLDRTELSIPSTGIGSLPVLADLRHTGDDSAVKATRVRAGLEQAVGGGGRAGVGYGLDVTMRAPNQVFIRGRGLDAELGGTVKLAGTTAAIVPSGGLSLIRGRLDLLGKRLTLSEATLQMQGALIPYVRIAATTESDGFAISAVIEGRADDPQVSFTSSPALPQEEALARLLFDKSLQNLSAFQAAQLAGAVATLAGKGGEGLIGKLRQSAGLDNLDIQSDGTGNTSVTAGKYLSDKLYTELTVDQDGKSTVNLNLDLSPHITLRGSVDDTGNTGVGVFLERDY